MIDSNRQDVITVIVRVCARARVHVCVCVCARVRVRVCFSEGQPRVATHMSA